MATAIKVILNHLDANGKELTHYPTESLLLSVATVDYNGIKAVLQSNNRLRGTSVHVHSYSNLDKQHNVSPNVLS